MKNDATMLDDDETQVSVLWTAQGHLADRSDVLLVPVHAAINLRTLYLEFCEAGRGKEGDEVLKLEDTYNSSTKKIYERLGLSSVHHKVVTPQSLSLTWLTVS